MKRFNSICIVTRDLPRLRVFYRAVLQLEPEGDEEYLTFPVAGAGFSIAAEQLMEAMAPDCMNGTGQCGAAFEFEVGDVDAAHDRLARLDVPIVKPPTTQPWGLRSVWFRDPDGNLVNFFAPIGESGGPPDLPALVRRYFQRLLNERDVTVCEEILAAEYVDHDAPPDTPPGPASVMAYVRGFLDDYPDLRLEVEDVIAEGNQAAARLVWRGHHRETGERYHKTGVVMIRFDHEGRMAERWSGYKTLD